MDLIQHILEHGDIKNWHKTQATLNIWKAEHNKIVGGIPNVPCMKISELGIAVRKVTGKMFGWSNTGENVLRLLQITHVAYMSNKLSKNTVCVCVCVYI